MPVDKLPSQNVLLHATKLAIMNHKPIIFDHWLHLSIYEHKSGEKILMDDNCPILKLYIMNKEYIIETNESLYVTLNIKKLFD